MDIQFVTASSARLQARIVDAGAMPPGADAALSEGARASRFAGKPGQLFEHFSGGEGAVSRLALVGAGEAGTKARQRHMEQAGAALAAKYGASGEAVLALDGAGLAADEVAAVLLGLRLRSWRYDLYRTRLPDDQKPSLTRIEVVGAADGAAAAWEQASAVAEGVEFARELVTEPGNVIYPESFVARAQARLAGTGVEIEVLDVAAMQALGMGALLGVAHGSIRAPRLLAMRWKGTKADKPTVFVGKGVTFDTGGISLKPPAGMEDMKWDMGGAAAVAGTMLTLARRKARADVLGVVGLVENMPDGGAQRPGDVVTSMSGQTIEVINTDAEGRLVLCDCLTWVQKQVSPAAIVDLATLTGAMIITLGHEHGGIFANDEDLADALLGAGKASGDKLWRLPLGKAYDKLIDSPIADMKNVGPREGGSITAAQFLQRFVEKGTPWAHLDIAGMVWAAKPGHSWDKGATGYGVRLLDQYVRATLEG
ncbi:MAG: leucyl aminopeptidase [Proteobacteria bacterium]|nr:leucyl aminopeptidase [Pseudomonadota bacterium]